MDGTYVIRVAKYPVMAARTDLPEYPVPEAASWEA